MQDDLYDCVRPRDPPDQNVCQDVLRYLDMELTKGKRLVPINVRSASIFVPISHVLEYREFWEDVDNDKRVWTQD